jgi:hypothetical protein
MRFALIDYNLRKLGIATAKGIRSLIRHFKRYAKNAILLLIQISPYQTFLDHFQ